MLKAVLGKLPVLFLALAISSCNGPVVPSALAMEKGSGHQKNTQTNQKSIDGRDIRSIFQDSKGVYWFGSKDNGLYRYDRGSVTVFTKKDGLSSNQIGQIQGDKKGNIYLMTSGAINKFDGKAFSQLKLSEDRNSKNQWTKGNDDVWFPARDGQGGAFRYDGTNLFFLKFPEHSLHKEYYKNNPNRSFSPYDVYTIYTDRSGSVWFGTGNFGAYRFNGSTIDSIYEKHWTETPSGGSFGIRSIFEDQTGKFWFCNTSFRYNISEQAERPKGGVLAYKREAGIKGAVHYFTSAVENDAGDMWLASDKEILRVRGDKITRYKVRSGSSDVSFYTLYRDRSGSIWAISHLNGLYKFNGRTFDLFTVQS